MDSSCIKCLRGSTEVCQCKIVNGIAGRIPTARNPKRIHRTRVSNGILFALLYGAHSESNRTRDSRAIVRPFVAIFYSVPLVARQRFICGSFKQAMPRG